MERAGPTAWTRRGDGLAVSIRLTPKSAKDALEGIEQLADGRSVIKARVRAVPEDGAANAALTKLLSKALRLPSAAVSLESGATSRLKTVLLRGEPAAIEAALRAALGLPRG